MKSIRKKAEKSGVFLDESELNRWNIVNREYVDFRLRLADLEMEKAAVAYKVDQIQRGRRALIEELVAKYGSGKDIKINSETGQVKVIEDAEN